MTNMNYCHEFQSAVSVHRENPPSSTGEKRDHNDIILLNRCVVSIVPAS